jgi:transposase
MEERLPLVPSLAHREGTFKRLNTALREHLRTRLGRNQQPSAPIVDSQTLKTTGVGGTERGFDPAKKVRGRKRHLLVDTEGLVLGVRIHSAKVPDADGIRLLCWSRRGVAFRVFGSCGSTRATRGGARGGSRK